MKIIIKATNLELTPTIEEYIHQKINGLDKFLGNMDRGTIEARVEVGRTTKHHQKGYIFRAEANLRLSGQLLRVEAEELELRTALDRVKDGLQREIKKYRGRQEAKYKRGARRAKKLIHLSPMAWFKRKKGSREKEEGI